MKNRFCILVLCLLLFNCRTVKKEWVKENFTEKSTTTQLKSSQDSTLRSEISKIETSVSKIETSVSKIENSATSSAENETTDVSGNIVAEDGKTKSVTIGGTTIKSNGANISFKTSSSKATSKQIETFYENSERKFELQEQTISELRTELNSLKSEFNVLESAYESQKQTRSKNVKKTGLSFGMWAMIIIILIVLVLLWYFRHSIPFLSKNT